MGLRPTTLSALESNELIAYIKLDIIILDRMMAQESLKCNFLVATTILLKFELIRFNFTSPTDYAEYKIKESSLLSTFCQEVDRGYFKLLSLLKPFIKKVYEENDRAATNRVDGES